MKKAKIGIVGGTGYTGVELLRLLASHDQIEVVAITSRAEKGRRVDDLYPSLRGHYALEYQDPADTDLTACDLVFFATPNGVAMHMADELLNAGVKMVDFSADFRIKDAKVWSKWYGMEHACPQHLSKAVYGLPELYRAQIETATLIANPGCYPTAVQLGYLPLVAAKAIDLNSLIADCKSGVSGAGRGASVATLMSEVNESVKAYAASGHRHLPEIKQQLVEAAGEDIKLTFVPHLMPMVRGIHATLYADLHDSSLDVQALYEDYYKNEPFVDVMPIGSHPETRSVRGTNVCRIALHPQPETGRIVILSVEDNLVKGAAGQAVHNMNLMLGFGETTALKAPALVP